MSLVASNGDLSLKGLYCLPNKIIQKKDVLGLLPQLSDVIEDPGFLHFPTHFPEHWLFVLRLIASWSQGGCLYSIKGKG